MVEFSKILKKSGTEGAAKTRLHAEPAAGEPKKKELRVVPRAVSPLPEPQEPPAPRREEAGEEPVRDPIQEPEPIKEIKPLFTQRIQRKILEETTAANISSQKREEARPSVSPAANAESLVLVEGPAAVHFHDAKSIYEDMMALARQLFSKDARYEQVDSKQIMSVVAEAIGAIGSGNEELIELAIVHVLKDERVYLFQHSVNVCILSIEIGFGVNYEMGRLMELGLAAFLHDIGMTCYENMVQAPRPLTPQEFEELKKHVDAGTEILKKINPGLSDAILTAHREIHERLDGSGYPAGKKTIQDYARIIALADGFESMIHPRPFRPKYSIMEVYKRIFDAKNKYDQVYIKALVDRIGFFPDGSWVQLNTKETGRVVRQNKKAPLRPVIRLEYSSDDRKLEPHEVKEVSLVQYPTLHVKRCFLDEADVVQP